MISPQLPRQRLRSILNRFKLDPSRSSELAEAETRFKELTGLGFTAAARTAAGETLKVASFDPTAEETLFFPFSRALSAVKRTYGLPVPKLARVTRSAPVPCSPRALQCRQDRQFASEARGRRLLRQ